MRASVSCMTRVLLIISGLTGGTQEYDVIWSWTLLHFSSVVRCRYLLMAFLYLDKAPDKY